MSELGERLLWLDMEMTGLDPETCVPIEVAAIVTDAELVEIEGATFEGVIHQSEEELTNLAPVVLEMHTANGLLDKVRASSLSLAAADAELAKLASTHCQAGRALLSGNTIAQDRRFIRRYMPHTEKTLHYRQLDVSSIKELVRRWYGGEKVFHKESAHTALADIRTSIAELRYYRENFFMKNDAEAK